MSVSTANPTTEQDDLFSPPPATVREDYFGEITIVDDWDCVLRRGPGKVKFDPNQHDISDKRVAIVLQLTCTSKDGHTFTLDQDDINTGSKWRATLPSLQKLGIVSRAQLRTLKGQWAHIKKIPTGETYESKQGAKAGQRVNELAWSFVALYPDQAACDTAQEAFWTSARAAAGANSNHAPLPTADLPSDLGANLPPNPSNNAKAFALQAATALWKVSGHDKAKFEDMLKPNKMITDHYPIDHPVIIALMDDDDADLPF